MHITRPSIRSVTLLVSAVALIVALEMFTTGSVQAATQPSVVPTSSVNLTHPYNFSTTFKSAHINECITLKVYGTVHYTYSYTVAPRGAYNDWTNQKLTNPTLSASVHGYNKGHCNTAGKVTSIDLQQSWTGYACDFNPSLSVSFPWGISFGGWPTCGNRNDAEYATGYGSGAGFTQYNSGSPTSFGNFENESGALPCYGVYVDTIDWVSANTISDHYTSNPWEVCLPK